MTIPGPFPTIPDHNTVRPADNQPCEKTYINAFALFVPTSSAALGIAFKASLMLCSHLHEQSGRTRKPGCSTKPRVPLRSALGYGLLPLQGVHESMVPTLMATQFGTPNWTP